MNKFYFSAVFAVLAACTEDKKGDTAESIEETVDPITFFFPAANSITEEPVEGAELCVIIPEDLTPCLSTDDDGEIEYTWESPSRTNILNRLTHPDYIMTLNTGFYNDAMKESWEPQIEENGKVQITYAMHTATAVDSILTLSGLSREEGKGHLAYILAGAEGLSVENAVITLKNDAGETAGSTVYGDPDGSSVTLDTSLSATSSSGGFSVLNVAPGQYTLEIAHESLSCTGSVSSQPNALHLPIEADTLTRGFLACQ